MEKQLNYIRLLPLKEMAFRRIAVALCNKPDILNFISEFQLNCEKVWCEDRFRFVSQTLSELLLPKSLKTQIIPIMKSVSDEILRWKLFHKELLNGDICVRVLKKLCWTTAGTVNYRETAGELMRCDILDLEKRFFLACFYCFESYVPMLWKQLPNEDKKTFYHGNISRIKKPRPQLFLPIILERAESKLSSYDLLRYSNGGPLNNSFERAAVSGNKTLAEYCLGKLTKAEREGSLVRAARCVIRYRTNLRFQTDGVHFIQGRLLSEVSCYLLSLMSAEEEIGILRELPCEVLRCCLDWPYQDLFLDAADAIWSFLPERKYGYLMITTFYTFINPGYYFPTSFQEFFLRSSVNFRKCFVDHECREIFVIREFISKKDTESIRIFLRNLEASDRARLVFTESVLYLIYYFSSDWPVLEVFLQEAALTKEQKQKLKVTFMEYGRIRGGVEWELNRRFFEFVDEGNAGAQRKRKSEDETLFRVKKLFSGRKENVNH